MATIAGMLNEEGENRVAQIAIGNRLGPGIEAPQHRGDGRSPRSRRGLVLDELIVAEPTTCRPGTRQRIESMMLAA